MDTLLLMGVWIASRPCLMPWIVLNFLIVLGLGAGVIFHLVPVLLPSLEQECSDISKVEAALKDIHRLIIIILLNIALALQMVAVSAVVKLFMDMKKEKVSEIVPSDSLKKQNVIKRKRNVQTSPRTYKHLESDDQIMKRSKGTIPLVNLGENDKKRDSWETLRFSCAEDFDKSFLP